MLKWLGSDRIWSPNILSLSVSQLLLLGLDGQPLGSFWPKISICLCYIEKYLSVLVIYIDILNWKFDFNMVKVPIEYRCNLLPCIFHDSHGQHTLNRISIGPDQQAWFAGRLCHRLDFWFLHTTQGIHENEGLLSSHGIAGRHYMWENIVASCT